MAGALAAAEPAAEFLPMAVWYGGGKARAPMLEPDARAKKEIWRHDLRQIKSLGFNAIRSWMDWATGEPAEGRYQFETLDVLLELAGEEGLKVILQVYMDAAPDWVGKKYPDSLFVAASGYVMKPESSPGYCNDHAGVREATLRFYAALAGRARRSPAFYGWDLWSEPHVINWATATFLPNAEYCFCAHSAARFRGWLRKKYGTLEALNRAWYRRFSSWDEVEPNRLSTILSYSDYIDWRLFIRDKLGEDLRARYEAVKRVAPDRVATSHAASPNLFTSPLAGDGSPDDWIMARQVDFYGTSFYPKHSYAVGRDPAWRGALLDFARSSGGGRGFWVGELQGGFGTVALNVSGAVTPEDLRVWSWSALAHGAKGLHYYAWYPMSSGYESGGFGLIQLDGTITERAREAGRVAQVVSAHQKLLLAARPLAAEVAVVFNPLVYMVGGRQRAATFGGPQGEVASIERDSMLGIHRALFSANVPVDFVHVNELGRESLARYKLVFLQYPLMMPEKAGAAIAEWVRGGGAAVAEARLAWNNERGYAAEIIPGLGLHEVFGCRETAVQSIPGSRTALRWTGGGLAGMREGDSLAARLYEETLEPLGERARVVARFADGRPAAVMSSYGRGKTLALGSYVAVAHQQQPEATSERFFQALVDWAGVARPVAVEGGPVEVRMMEAGAERLVVVFNHQDNAVEPLIRVPGEWTASDLATGAEVRRLGKRLAPGEVWVVRLQAAARP
jgi:beta-galactosidase